MTTAAGLSLSRLSACWRERAAFAQPPTAPPPHPPLAELVKEYVRLGLPLPPPDAPLVKIRQITGADGEGTAKFTYELGFQLPRLCPVETRAVHDRRWLATRPVDQPEQSPARNAYR